MKVIRKIKEALKSLDLKTTNLMKNGFKLSFVLILISTYILFTYQFIYKEPNLFYVGISLFKTALSYATAFLMFGLGFSSIKNELGI